MRCPNPLESVLPVLCKFENASLDRESIASMHGYLQKYKDIQMDIYVEAWIIED